MPPREYRPRDHPSSQRSAASSAISPSRRRSRKVLPRAISQRLVAWSAPPCGKRNTKTCKEDNCIAWTIATVFVIANEDDGSLLSYLRKFVERFCVSEAPGQRSRPTVRLLDGKDVRAGNTAGLTLLGENDVCDRLSAVRRTPQRAPQLQLAFRPSRGISWQRFRELKTPSPGELLPGFPTGIPDISLRDRVQLWLRRNSRTAIY